MKVKIDTVEKTIQVEETVDLDELTKEFGGKGFKIMPSIQWQYYPTYPVYPVYPELPYYWTTDGITADGSGTGGVL